MSDFLTQYAEIMSDPAHLAVEFTFVLLDYLAINWVASRIKAHFHRDLAREHQRLDAEHGVTVVHNYPLMTLDVPDGTRISWKGDHGLLPGVTYGHEGNHGTSPGQHVHRDWNPDRVVERMRKDGFCAAEVDGSYCMKRAGVPHFHSLSPTLQGIENETAPLMAEITKRADDESPV